MNNGKTFEQRLNSLQIGCIIFAVLTGIGLLSNLSNPYVSPLSILLSIALLCSFYFIYTYTKKRDIKGPMIEMVVGGLYLFEALLYLFTLSIFSFLVIIFPILIGAFLIYEGNTFYKIIKNNAFDDNMNNDMNNNNMYNNNMNNNMNNNNMYNNNMNNNMNNNNMYNNNNMNNNNF